jgi:hypothetical protein
VKPIFPYVKGCGNRQCSHKHGAPHLLLRTLSKIKWPANLYKDCWLWQASKQRGYAQILMEDRRRPTQAHRVTFQFLRNEIPADMELDHLCRVRHCVNPWHLEIVTPRENWSRGYSISAQRRRQTHCIRGHVLEPIKWKPHHRFCRTCKNDQDRARRANGTSA